MNVIKIDGKEYDCLVVALREKFTIKQSENAGETIGIGGEMILDPIGTLYSHEVTFKRRKGKEQEFEDLYDTITRPRRSGVQIDVVHGQSSISYKAYVTSGGLPLIRRDLEKQLNVWGELTVEFVPTAAQVTL